MSGLGDRGTSSNRVCPNSCLLGSYSQSVKFVSTCHDKKAASTFLVPLIYCMFN